ncbi:MAG: electron transport complex subunit RsxB [Marinagarivorans sp.]
MSYFAHLYPQFPWLASPWFSSLVALASLCFICGLLLGFAALRFKVEGDPLVEQIDALLPQTQCGQCGHPGCRPYAQAIAEGEAINRCPPGGQATIDALAHLLGVAPEPLDAEHGVESSVKTVAFIREAECIGCTKCIQACPVDAIVGAAKLMHTVIASECTGCDLCVEPCPVDCIDMRPVQTPLQQWPWPKPSQPSGLIASDRAL